MPQDDSQKLRIALRHWQSLAIDYEGLINEFSGLNNDVSRDDLLRAAHEFTPDKVDEKEIVELIECGPGRVRQPSEIVHLLKKRGEWIAASIDNLRRQIDASRLEKTTLPAKGISKSPEEESELPVFEIEEAREQEESEGAYAL